jgi:hypothetical protein
MLRVDTIIPIEYSIRQEYSDVMIPRLQSGHLGAGERMVKPAALSRMWSVYLLWRGGLYQGADEQFRGSFYGDAVIHSRQDFD